MGFSFHDSYEAFVKLIDDYDWEFAQIQYNYLDNELQAGDRGLAYAKSKGIPLNIMEPIKGGNLIFPNYPAIDEIRARHGITESNAELALRYVFDKENLHVFLSGMNELDQVKENIAITDRCGVGCLTAAETEARGYPRLPGDRGHDPLHRLPLLHRGLPAENHDPHGLLLLQHRRQVRQPGRPAPQL